MAEKDHLNKNSKAEIKGAKQKRDSNKSTNGKKSLKSVKTTKKTESNKNKMSQEFRIQIPRKEIEEKFEQAVKKYSSEMKIDGFRKGKIPLEVVKSKYRDLIMDEIVNKVIEDYTFKTIKKEKIRIISSPIVKDFDFKEGKDLKALVSVDLFPEVIIPDLSKITVSIKKEMIKSEKYDEKKQIDLILNNNKRKQIVKDRCIKDNDFVEFKIQSQFIDTKRMMPKQDSFFEVKNVKHNEFGDIYQDFLGKCKGEKFDLEKKYGKDFNKKKWAGKKIKHFIEIKNIFEYITPVFDDKFLKSMGFKDKESFKSKLKEEFENHSNRKKDQIIINEIREKLIELCDFSIPDSIIDQEVQRTQSQYAQMIMTLPEDKRSEYLKTVKEDSERSIKFSFILEEVKKNNGIDIKNDDLEKEFKKIAEANGMDVKDVRKYYMNNEQKESLKDSIGRNLAIDLLKEKIKVKEV